jgi:hypothetical protein
MGLIMISIEVRQLMYDHDVIINGAQSSRLIMARIRNTRDHTNPKHRHGRTEMERMITVRPTLVSYCEGRTEGYCEEKMCVKIVKPLARHLSNKNGTDKTQPGRTYSIQTCRSD